MRLFPAGGSSRMASSVSLLHTNLYARGTQPFHTNEHEEMIGSDRP